MSGDWHGAFGSLHSVYDDIPAEMLIGLDRGKLGDWLQEVHDAENDIEIIANCVVIAGNYEGRDDDTHRVDVMILRAYLAWKGREGQ